MSKQHIDFKQGSESTGDSGEVEAAAIKPLEDGEPGLKATFNRPHENLRLRTEAIRSKLEELLYVGDADRSLMLDGGGTITWGGTVANGGTGLFTITSDLEIRPFLAPASSIRPSVELYDANAAQDPSRTVVARGIATSYADPVSGLTNRPARAYSGANKVTVRMIGIDGGTLACTVNGAPADNFEITYNTALGGTTCQQLVDYMASSANAGAVAFRAAGLELVLGDAAVGSNTFTAANQILDHTFEMGRAVDAEIHVISAAGLAAFFADVENLMADGDTLAIYYDAVNTGDRANPAGRRQSLADAPESNSNVDSNLFLVRRMPHWVANALPIATVQDGTLIFRNGTAFSKDQEGPLRLTAIKDASNVDYGGGPAWLDGSLNPATTVEAQLDKLITDLVDVSTVNSGADKIGAAVVAGTPYNLNTAGQSVQQKIAALLSHINTLHGAAGKLASSQTWTNSNTFTGAVSFAAPVTTNNWAYATPRTRYLHIPAYEFVAVIGAGVVFDQASESWVVDGSVSGRIDTHARLPQGATITAVEFLLLHEEGNLPAGAFSIEKHVYGGNGYTSSYLNAGQWDLDPEGQIPTVESPDWEWASMPLAAVDRTVPANGIIEISVKSYHDAVESMIDPFNLKAVRITYTMTSEEPVS